MKEITIYECLYSSNQKPILAGAQPLHISNQKPERRELQAYVEAYRRRLYLQNDYTGIFSPKFEIKTHVSINDFIRFASSQDGDICHINPFPQISYWSFNVWEQGEIAHPGLSKAAQKILDAVGIDLQISATPRHSASVLAYSNFWIGNIDFWRSYVGQVLVPISNFLDEHPSHPATNNVLEHTNHTDPAPLLPFIVERLYSTWLSTHSFKFSHFPQSAEDIAENYCNNSFERLLFSQMQNLVNTADYNCNFPGELREHMANMCRLFQQHFFDYYAHRKHPHSGQPVREIITRERSKN